MSSNTNPGGSNRSPLNTTVVVVVLITLIGVLLLAMMGLYAIGRQPDQVLYTTVGPILLSLVGFVGAIIKLGQVLEKASDVEAKVDTVVHATNGKLDARFAEVHERLDQLGTAPSSQITTSSPSSN